MQPISPAGGMPSPSLSSRRSRSAYGFEDVAIVPGDVTINPDQTTTDLEIGSLHMAIPILAAAMDAVVSPSFAVKMHRAGGLGVMNLEGLQARYDDPEERLGLISEAPKEEATAILQNSTPRRSGMSWSASGFKR